jgi:hypothetical protein
MAMLAAVLLGGCRTPDVPAGADYPYHGPILKPDGTTPHVPGAAP